MSYINTFGGDTVSPIDPAYRAFALTADTTLVWPRFNANATNVVAKIMDVTPDTSGWTVTMPDARQVSVGTTALFINRGGDSFTVDDAGGNTISSVPSTQAIYAYLTDNSTEAGTWQALQFAVGSAAVVAADLAGDGLQAVGALLDTTWRATTSSTSPYNVSTTAGTGDKARIVIWQGGTGTFNLPAASSSSGFFFAIKNLGSGSVTVTPNGADTVDGAASFTVDAGESYVFVRYSSSAWVTIGNDNVFTASYISISIAGTGTYTVPASEQGYLIYRLAGALTGNRTVEFPAAVGQFYFDQETTGSYTVTIQTTAGGASFTVAQGVRVVAYCDGTNFYKIIETTYDEGGNIIANQVFS